MKWGQPSTTLDRPNVTYPVSFRSDSHTKTMLSPPEGQWHRALLLINVKEFATWARSGISNKSDERDPDEAWFWTDEWQAKEREADEYLRVGRFERFETEEAFDAALKARRHANADL